MSRASLAEKTECIRSAVPSDVETIYALMVEVFGKTYLPYTIYQTPKSCIYIHDLIEQSNSHHFFVLYQNCQLLGYYHAVRRERDLFLNNIAIAPTMQGYGWGQVLLDHFAQLGRAAGYPQLELDVYGSNRTAYNWYLGNGYQVKSLKYLTRLSMDAQSSRSSSLCLSYDADQWHQALREEQRRGFSKIICNSDLAQLTLGLIAGEVCKLIDYVAITLEEAVAAVAATFYPHRRVLVVSSTSQFPPCQQVLSSEHVFRLCKTVI